MNADSLILKLDCADRVGLLAQVTGCVAARHLNLLEVGQFTDTISGRFFARLVMEPTDPAWDSEAFRKDVSRLAQQLGATWTLRSVGQRTRTAILVSREDHCLADLLWRWRSDELPLEIPMVISNHETCRNLAEREGIPFCHLPVGADKEAHFRAVAKMLQAQGIELVILARYMQVLPDWFCEEYYGRVINIHHSFLPAFVGANPYQRAYERGVKLIGATCHYATPELDAGPIIEQEVVRVEHYHDPDDLKRLGRDCERIALARGVRYHLEDRVLLHGSRAIVFRD